MEITDKMQEAPKKTKHCKIIFKGTGDGNTIFYIGDSYCSKKNFRECPFEDITDTHTRNCMVRDYYHYASGQTRMDRKKEAKQASISLRQHIYNYIIHERPY